MRSRLSLGVAFGAMVAVAIAVGGSSIYAVSNYDGAGIWSQPDCSFDDCYQLDLVQNPRGDLTLRDGFCESVDCHVSIVLRRLGRRPKDGAASEYYATIKGLPGDERACINQEGSAYIDASSVPATLTVTVTGVNWWGPEVGCLPETNTIVLQK
jgi:hypothetical protein